MPKNKNLILWDWNGTIVDDAWLFVEILNFFLKQTKNTPVSINDYRQLFCFPLEDFYKKINLYDNRESFNKISEQFIKLYRKRSCEPKLIGGIIDVVRSCSYNNTLCLTLSAQNNIDLKNSIKHYKLCSFFNSVFGVDNIMARGKVDLARRVVDKYKADKVLVVGDTSLDYDVACAIGADCYLVSWGHYNVERLDVLPAPVFSSVLKLKQSVLSFISH